VKGFLKVFKYYLIASPLVVILGLFLFLSVEKQPSDTKIIIDLNLGNDEEK